MRAWESQSKIQETEEVPDPTTGGQKLFWEEYHSINCIFIYDEVNKVLGETNAVCKCFSFLSGS